MTTAELLEKAAAAKNIVAGLSQQEKNNALEKMAEALVSETKNILAANAEDMEKAKGTVTEVMLDRLRLDESRIKGMAQGITDVAKLPDPVGTVLESFTRPNGMSVEKVSVPIGVVAIIYESRPNVTSDAAALCFKSGNVCVLKSGKEAFSSSNAIVNALKKGLTECGISGDCINLVQDTTREGANTLMKAEGYVDLLIPRGGAGLISACVQNATVPCIQTGTGICHVYVDKEADFDKALRIIENAKTSRPSVCNAEEVLLVHKDIAQEFLPKVKQLLCDKREAEGKTPVELRIDPEAAKYIEGTPAGERDFDTEFLDYILAVKVVNSAEEAICHIGNHSTGHSEAIVTEDDEVARLFTRLVDSAAVYVNVSTRFTDGGEFGLGCEMGISTQKLHARGPMGLRELNTYKYIIKGNGQIR